MLKGSFEYPKHMFKLIDKKIIALLRKLFLLNWPFGISAKLFSILTISLNEEDIKVSFPGT